MPTSNAKQNFRSDDAVWVLLAELSLRDFLSNEDRRDESTAGYLLQTLPELGMSTECMENIARTLAGFAKGALVRTKQAGLEFSGQLRIFCQKTTMDEANTVKTRRPLHTEPDKNQKQILPDSGANTIGGWGYFIIERGEDLPPVSSAIPHDTIELYLYKEGEPS
jgi:hypothetical protein